MKYPYLDKIQKNGDVKKLPQQELPLLCEDIRNFLIESVSSTGGHLSSNLCVVGTYGGFAPCADSAAG